jgi:LmbE family N-acetylglucosaminyl deacetylase
MQLANPNADLYAPDGMPFPDAIARTTQLAVVAHQDDLEILAYAGIAACYEKPDQWFGGVVVTDGAGSARTGPYADFSNEQMVATRIREQRAAAAIGKYAFVAQLGYPSAPVNNGDPRVVDDIERILRAARPAVLYLHNPADKHPTHLAVLARTVAALRRLPQADRPRRILGVEVWRDLDWLADDAKVALPVGDRPELAAALIAVFDSQIAGGKQYDQAILGRRRANATFYQPHQIDSETGLSFAVDLSILATRDDLSLADVIRPHLATFSTSVLDALRLAETGVNS